MNSTLAKNPKKKHLTLIFTLGLATVILTVFLSCIFLPIAINCANNKLSQTTGTIESVDFSHEASCLVQIDGETYSIFEDLAYFADYVALPQALCEGAVATVWYSATPEKAVVSIEIDGTIYFDKETARTVIATNYFAFSVLLLSLSAIGLGAVVQSIVRMPKPPFVVVTLADFCTFMARNATHPKDRVAYEKSRLAPIQRIAQYGAFGLIAFYVFCFVALLYSILSLQDVGITLGWTVAFLTSFTLFVLAVVLWFVLKKQYFKKVALFHADKFRFEIHEQGQNVFMFGGVIYSFTFAGLTMTSYADRNNTITIPYDQLHLIAEPAFKGRGELASIWLFHFIEENPEDQADELLEDEEIAENQEESYQSAPEMAPMQKEGLVFHLNQDLYNALLRFGVRVDNLDELLQYVTDPQNVFDECMKKQ